MKNYAPNNLLAILPEKVGSVIAQREMAIIDGVDIQDAMNRKATKFNNVKGDVMVVPIHGFISHKPTVWSAVGLESSSEVVGLWIDSLMNNPSVGAVVFDVDSPGGSVQGLTAISDKIYSYRGKKPIIAVVNDMMASAAYFIGSAADEIVADPDSLTGSIGTLFVHEDWSKALERIGVDVTFIHAGKYKVEGNPYEPLDDTAKQSLQDMVNQYYEVFVSAVARNRGTTAATVKADYGQGRIMRAPQAKSAGLIDRIATLEQVTNALLPKENRSSRARNMAYAIKARNLQLKRNLQLNR
jgi:signal peptide peptidase SppA